MSIAWAAGYCMIAATLLFWFVYFLSAMRDEMKLQRYLVFTRIDSRYVETKYRLAIGLDDLESARHWAEQFRREHPCGSAMVVDRKTKKEVG